MRLDIFLPYDIINTLNERSYRAGHPARFLSEENMTLDFYFFLHSILFGTALAMDAFSVSVANGLNEPKMKKSKLFTIASVFAFFQFLMPLIGWFCVHTAAQHFKEFEKFIPWIALVLLLFIGGKMIYEGIKCSGEECDCHAVTLRSLLVQGVATSIDALSVGFTIENYTTNAVFICCGIIAIVTFAICTAGVIIGKKFGAKFSGKAPVLGGLILIFIGIEIFVSNLF